MQKRAKTNKHTNKQNKQTKSKIIKKIQKTSKHKQICLCNQAGQQQKLIHKIKTKQKNKTEQNKKNMILQKQKH